MKTLLNGKFCLFYSVWIRTLRLQMESFLRWVSVIVSQGHDTQGNFLSHSQWESAHASNIAQRRCPVYHRLHTQSLQTHSLFLTLVFSDVCSGTSGAARPSLTVCHCAKRWRASASGPSPWTGRWGTSAPESTRNDVIHSGESHISWIFMFITQSIYLFWEIIYLCVINVIHYLLTIY